MSLTIKTEDGTIDLTDTVERMRKLWVTLMVNLVDQAIKSTPWLSWLRIPVLSQVVSWLIEKLLVFVSEAAVMQGFFLNTAARKAAQATDFIEASDFLEALPPTATKHEVLLAETRLTDAFHRFTRFTN